MNETPHTRPDDPLRALLRAADPLAGEAPPSEVEIARWRAALRDGRQRAAWHPGWVRVLVPALGVAGALLLAILLMRSDAPAPAPAEVARGTSAIPRAPAPTPEPPSLPAPQPPHTEAPAIARMPAPPPAATPDPIPAEPPPPVAGPTPPAPADRAASGRPAQSLQFTAANGTRILWILDPKVNL